ncbi:hydroxypyruvate isomerase [Catenibacillus scindens]|uniref:Hydroxypyruvate isomerase n=1 Tax=Catenibacillus scindens TaxID=673271 RepID=A0A7W8H8Q5_9FIRM|nr:TIM barrel protein [Catenibacillus scindens]MBB5263941.1 hydroxypyruvate isomerase [Catenibacillus scindens]
MKYSLCIDLLYLEITPQGPVFADTDKILAGMELAKKAGFDCVEFWDWANKDVDRLVAKQKELGLTVTSICAKDRGTLADPSTHEKALEGLKETIEVAKRFDCKNIIVTADEMPGFSHEESHKNIVEGFKMQAPLAEAAGVTLILEPIYAPFPGFFRDSAEPFAVIDEVGSESLKLLYDIFHYQLMEGNITNTLKNNLDKIGHIHIAAAPNRTEITDGEINYSYILKTLKDLGYDKYVALEYSATMDKEASLAACRALFI